MIKTHSRTRDSMQTLRSILPDKILNNLDSLRSSISSNYFMVGDSAIFLDAVISREQERITAGTSELSQEKQDKVLLIGRMDIYNFVADSVGVSLSSVRKYVSVCKKFPKDSRTDDVPFSHYRFAIQYPDFKDKIIDISLRYLSEHGRAPSRRWLSANFKNLHNPDGGQEIVREIETMLGLGEAQTEFQGATDGCETESDNTYRANSDVRPAAYNLMTQIERIISLASNSLEALGATSQERDEIVDMIGEISRKINNIRSR